MKNRLKSNLPAKLARGRERFEKWRSKHKTYHRLPEYLWSAAARLAGEYGLNRTARALRLDYKGLKKRIEVADSGDLSQTTVGPKFLELPLSGTNVTAECIIECENINGIKLRIHLKGPQLPDLAALNSVLWIHGR
ncbi:MAG: hypothetical protein WC749_14320 [Dehalococcoidia bacterium]